MTISLVHPSRGRPEKAHATARYWADRAGAGVFWQYILSLDSDDPKLKDYDLLRGAQNMKRIVNQNKSVVEATNIAAKEIMGDILIYLSDDFKCPDNWGELVLKEFEGETKPLLIKVDDCLQGFHVPVLTIPIMNRALYERLGYFWNPEYKSMFCDEDLYWTAKKLGALKMCPHLKFPHEHPANGKAPDDDTYRASAKNWNQGQQVFIKRKAAGFPV